MLMTQVMTMSASYRQCHTITTLSAECPTGVTITPVQESYEPGDLLTCNADGYDPTYTWTGVVNGVNIVAHTGSTYTLPVGDFQLICTSTVDELMCTYTASDDVEASTVGKYEIQLNSLVTMTMLLSLSVS